MDVDWSEWWGISMIASVFLVMGGVTGFRGGAKGLNLKLTLRRAARNGIVTVIAGTTIVAVAIAGFQLWELGEWSEREVREYGLRWEYEDSFVSAHPDGLHHGLDLNYEAYWNHYSYGCGNCWGPCSPSWCAAQSPLELNRVVDRRIARGAIWAFLTPMWILFGSVPLLGAATVGYHMGLSRQCPPIES